MTQPDTSRPEPPAPPGLEDEAEAEPEPVVPPAVGGVGPIDRVRTALSGHLGDGLAMSLAAGGASLVGMISWIVAARALTPAELGTATAFVSALLLIAGCTELNLGVGLLRWLPRAGGAAPALLRRSAAVVAVLAAAGASVYLLLPGASVIVDASAGATGGRLTGAAVFVLAAVLYALFQQQDFVLVGLGRAWWAPARTLLFAAGRLGILLVAGASLTTGGVVASWVVPTGACVLLITLQSWIVMRGRSGGPRAMPARREVVGFLGPTYLGRVATSVLFNQIPLLIIFRFGPEMGASFFLVWQAVTVIDVVAHVLRLVPVRRRGAGARARRRALRADPRPPPRGARARTAAGDRCSPRPRCRSSAQIYTARGERAAPDARRASRSGCWSSTGSASTRPWAAACATRAWPWSTPA